MKSYQRHFAVMVKKNTAYSSNGDETHEIKKKLMKCGQRPLPENKKSETI
jgi:hypothetical protein